MVSSSSSTRNPFLRSGREGERVNEGGSGGGRERELTRGLRGREGERVNEGAQGQGGRES